MYVAELILKGNLRQIRPNVTSSSRSSELIPTTWTLPLPYYADNCCTHAQTDKRKGHFIAHAQIIALLISFQYKNIENV
jgi:hypothetical protein